MKIESARDASILLLVFDVPEIDLVETYAGIIAGLEAGVLKPVVRRELRLADAVPEQS